jgi:hypothetical protein
MIIIQRHDERDVFNAEVIVFTENINQTLAHITINPTLDGIIDRGDPPFNLKENIEEPLGIGIKMLPMGDEHIVAYGLVAMIHCLLEGWYVLWGSFFYNLTEHLPVLGDMVVTILLCVADSPVTGDRENDVVFLQKLFQIRELIGMVEEIFC